MQDGIITGAGSSPVRGLLNNGLGSETPESLSARLRHRRTPAETPQQKVERRAMVLSRFRSEPLPVPDWERRDGRDSLMFTAVRTRMWVFGVAIAVITLGAGGAVSAAAILLTPDSSGTARTLIIAAALCLCLPLVLLAKAPFRARTVQATLTYDPDSLTIMIDSIAHRIPLREIDRLVWCTGTEYSRIVLDGSPTRCSLLVGIARPTRGHRADLPETPVGLRRALEGSGLSATAATPGYTRYQR